MTAIQNRVKFLNHKYSKQKIKIHKHSWRFGSDANWLFGLSILAYNCLKFSHSWNWHLRLIFTFMCFTKFEKNCKFLLFYCYLSFIWSKKGKKNAYQMWKKKNSQICYMLLFVVHLVQTSCYVSFMVAWFFSIIEIKQKLIHGVNFTNMNILGSYKENLKS